MVRSAIIGLAAAAVIAALAVFVLLRWYRHRTGFAAGGAAGPLDVNRTAQSATAAALRAIVEDFEEDEAPLQNEIEKKLAARVCKRMAVKAGQTLSPEEQRALLTDLETCESPRTCPHGRPTMIHLSVEMLERQFGRRGAR